MSEKKELSLKRLKTVLFYLFCLNKFYLFQVAKQIYFSALFY